MVFESLQGTDVIARFIHLIERKDVNTFICDKAAYALSGIIRYLSLCSVIVSAGVIIEILTVAVCVC